MPTSSNISPNGTQEQRQTGITIFLLLHELYRLPQMLYDHHALFLCLQPILLLQVQLLGQLTGEEVLRRGVQIRILRLEFIHVELAARGGFTARIVQVIDIYFADGGYLQVVAASQGGEKLHLFSRIDHFMASNEVNEI